MKTTEAIKNFLTAKTHKDLSILYNEGMEIQVNVAQDGGDRVENIYNGRKWHGWTDGLQTWKSFRIPYNANTTPEYDLDKPINFDLAEHAEGIGMTGWDWINKRSRWVAFDFDSIINHQANSLSNDEMERVKQEAFKIPWVSIRKSTSGLGLHLYVFVDVPTDNHNEHAALGRAILGKMSAISGFNFEAKVDCCGGNMWVWHRKMTGTDGLQLVKQGVPLEDIPINWKDHIQVIKGTKKRVVPSTMKDDEECMFEVLTGQRSMTQLEPEHSKLIEWLEEQDAVWWWDSDRQMLVTHTYHLQKAHLELSMTGVFSTNSKGTNLNEQNCFAFPVRGGGWCVRRFTPGIQESPSWDQDPNGWTRCYLNIKPDLQTSARVNEGIEHKKGGFIFRTLELASKAAQSLGAHIDYPIYLSQRETKLIPHKDGRLVVEVKREDHDSNPKGWLADKKVWSRIYNVQVNSTIEADVGNYDDLLRHIVSEDGADLGWVIKTDGEWRSEPLNHLKSALKSMGLSPRDADDLIGSSILKCWTIVNRPFEPEYPGDRKWNRNSAQFRFKPSDSESLSYPHWLKILQHVGSQLDDSVQSCKWCSTNGIISGADYLKCWIASMFQFPTRPLPYLFIFGETQNSGKSIFHEAIQLLLTSGYQRADHAIGSNTGFNGELENSVLCVVEEVDLARNKTAYNKIKDWVTSRHISIRKMHHDSYLIPNTTHWIQCANDSEYCPVFPGDTRITMCNVPPLKEVIPKNKLITLLEKEAPDFLASVLRLEIPESNDRLNIPALATELKSALEKKNISVINNFLEEYIEDCNGAVISLDELYTRFKLSLDDSESMNWSKIRFGKEMPIKYPKGRHTVTGQLSYANLKWIGESIAPSVPYKLSGTILVRRPNHANG